MNTFFCTLTGDAETPKISDLSLPISSLSLRRTSNGVFVSVVVQGLDYVDDISDRFNGNIEIVWAYGGEFVEKLADVPLDQITPNEGAKSLSVSLSGEDTATAWEPGADAVVIDHVLSKSPNRSGGQYTYNIAGPCVGMIPGVDVTSEDHTFTLGEFQLEISGDNLGVWIKEA